MKFLIKIEEAIDQLILNFVEMMKKATPHFIFDSIDWLKHSPHILKHKIGHYIPQVRAFLMSIVGFFQRYLTMFKGNFVGMLIYLKSEEFKKKNKFELLLAPLKNPVKSFGILCVTCVLGYAGFTIFVNTQKIITGTKALRAPASVHVVEEPIVEFKKLKYSVLEEKEISLDITLIAASVAEKEKIEHIEKEIEERLLEIHLKPTQLPLTEEVLTAFKAEIVSKITEAKLKSVEVKQVLEGRPNYFLQIEKMAAFKNINLQLFLEDTRRNRQVWIDFTALASNRNAVLFLKDNDIEVHDYLNMNVEPVIPQLPIEEEGRQIIKEKIRSELNEYLKENGIEGKILEIYVDYLIVS